VTAPEVAAALRIPPGLLAEAGWRDADDAAVRDALGHHGHRDSDLAGIVIPVRHPRTGESLGHICRLTAAVTGVPRYLQPQGFRWLLCYGTDLTALDDCSVPVVLAEGPKSALALLALAQRSGRRLVAIALCGCWGWRRTITHERRADGTLAPVTGPSPSLDWLDWTGRDAIIALDGDARGNPSVAAALRGLAQELAGRGASVRLAQIPPEAGEKGAPDDVLERCGDDAAIKMLDAAKPWADCAHAEAEAALAALEKNRKTDPWPAVGAIAAVADPARRALLVGRLAAEKIPGLTKAEIERQCAARHAEAETQRQAAAEAARRGMLLGMSVDGAALLDALAAWLRVYVIMSAAQADAAALWLLHGWALDAADYTPYLHITAPEKRCGKSRLLEVLEVLAARAWRCDRTTAAALLRSVERDSPTLLLDEWDAAKGSGDEYAEAMRGRLNSGFRRGGAYRICVGEDREPKDYPTFCAKAIAGIGRLPDTVADRSLRIALRRKAPNERVQPFRRRDAEPQAAYLRRQCEAWAMQASERLRGARPAFPAGLNDRQQDITEPLLAIADTTGGEWPERARRALATICTGEAAADESIGTKLLADVKAVFAEGDRDRIASRELAEALGQMEDRPWAEWGRGQKPITPPQVARELGRFGLCPRTIRDGEARYKGYLAADFSDAWARYLAVGDSPPPNSPVPSGDTVTTSVNIDHNGDFRAVTEAACHASENGVFLNKDGHCHRVTAPNGKTGQPGTQPDLFAAGETEPEQPGLDFEEPV
jgi:hypothetical protein